MAKKKETEIQEEPKKVKKTKKTKKEEKSIKPEESAEVPEKENDTGSNISDIDAISKVFGEFFKPNTEKENETESNTFDFDNLFGEFFNSSTKQKNKSKEWVMRFFDSDEDPHYKVELIFTFKNAKSRKDISTMSVADFLEKAMLKNVNTILIK